ncbi:MAG: LysR substrate-binding domain-containing protein [Alphaproteobacteria bacterium]|nr:LysR substrate-binding domain-containing protein [Alphaproteobacteria bacterium]
MLDDYQAALESTNEFRSKPSGMLRLNVAPPAADFVLADAIPRFLVLYPEISVDICVNSEFADIVAERFDAGIRNGERLERDMIAVRVSGEMPIVVAAAPAYLARRGTPRTPQDVAAHDCIRFRLPSGALFPWRFRFKRRSLDVHVQGRLAVNDRKIALAAARDGVGLVQVPLAYIDAEIEAGRLVTVLDDWAPPPVDGFFLYYPSRRQIRPALKALVDFLRDARRGGAARGTTAAQPFPEALWPQSPKPTIAAGQA